MSNFFKIPQSPLTVIGPSSVPLGSVYGTNFSILQTGGYMEVYSLSDLNYVVPTGTTGPIEYSANTIPIQYTKGTGSIFSFDSITLNSDNISSGRRKLGMLVYVYETNKIYQHSISNYDTLWNNATGSTGVGGDTVVISNYGTVVKGNSVAGRDFISSWTASTIEGIDGYTNLNATWRILSVGGSGGGSSITGGTFDSNTGVLTLTSTGGSIYITGFTTSSTFTGGTVTGSTFFSSGLSATTISATTYLNLPIDVRVTGGTYSNGNATFTNNTGGTFTVSGFSTTQPFTGGTVSGVTTFTSNLNVGGALTANTVTANSFYGDGSTLSNLPDIYVSAMTFNQGNYNLTITRNDNTSFTTSLGILSSDFTVTGGTYDQNTGTATFVNNTGGTFNVTGFMTGFTDIYVSGATYLQNNATGTLTLRRNDNNTISITGFTDIRLTGATYSNNTGTLTLSNNSGSTITATGFNYITGGTYNSGTSTLTFTTNTGQTVNITGITSSSGTFSGGTVTGPSNFTSGLTANTISATTYSNLPVSGLTQGSNITITNNGTGNYTISSSAGASTFTGGTVSGPTTFTSGLTANTISATTITATRFTGNLTGSSTQLLLSAATANADYYPILASAVTGNQLVFTDSAFRYNPSLDRITVTNIVVPSITGGTAIITGSTTISGNTTIIGDTNISGATNMAQSITASIFVASNNRIVESNSGGTVSATKVIIDAYLTSGGTVANLLENGTNWSPSGVYTGSTITGTYQGQKHYSPIYFFEAVQDNLFIRLQRV